MGGVSPGQYVCFDSRHSSSDSDLTLRCAVPGFNFRPRSEVASLVGSTVQRGGTNPWRLRRSMTGAGLLAVRGLRTKESRLWCGLFVRGGSKLLLNIEVRTLGSLIGQRGLASCLTLRRRSTDAKRWCERKDPSVVGEWGRCGLGTRGQGQTSATCNALRKPRCSS